MTEIVAKLQALGLNDLSTAITKERLEMMKVVVQRNEAMMALDAVILFHSGGPWNNSKIAKWKSITGAGEATSKILCKHIRKVLGDA